MYLLKYNGINQEVSTKAEVIQVIKSLHLEYKTKKPQVLSILINNKNCLNLCIGDINNNSTLMYISFSDNEDDIIAYNPNIDNHDERVSIFYVGETKTNHFLMWLLPFEMVLSEVEFFLNNNCLSDKLSWHAH